MTCLNEIPNYIRCKQSGARVSVCSSPSGHLPFRRPKSRRGAHPASGAVSCRSTAQQSLHWRPPANARPAQRPARSHTRNKLFSSTLFLRHPLLLHHHLHLHLLLLRLRVFSFFSCFNLFLAPGELCLHLDLLVRHLYPQAQERNVVYISWCVCRFASLDDRKPNLPATCINITTTLKKTTLSYNIRAGRYNCTSL